MAYSADSFMTNDIFLILSIFSAWNRISANVSSLQIAGHSMILVENHKLALIGGISKSKSRDQQVC